MVGFLAGESGKRWLSAGQRSASAWKLTALHEVTIRWSSSVNSMVFSASRMRFVMAARGLVGVHPDEAGDRRGARDALFGQQPLHLPGRRAVVLSGDLFPDGQLALAVGGDGEGLEHR